MPIAKGQLEWEDQARSQQPDLLILDTHLLSNMLWSQTLFGDCPAWLESALLEREYHLHLLLSPLDVPWVDDGQRCQPDLTERLGFYEACERWLQRHQQPYVSVQGNWQARRDFAIATLTRLLKSVQ
jgi:nicotinamide riboside kinase